MKSIEIDIIKKANLQRAIHSFFEGRTRVVSTILKTINIILPAIITFVAFSDLTFLVKFAPWLNSDIVKLTIGLSAFFLFILGVIIQIFKLDERHSDHRRAIELYSQLLRDIKGSKEIKENEEQQKSKIDIYNQRYQQISANSRSFTDKQFNKAELYFLKNRAKRQARKKLPFGWPWQIRSSAINVAKEIYEKEKHTDNVVSLETKKSNNAIKRME